MHETPVDRRTFLAGLPPLPEADPWPEIRALGKEVNRKLIVLDDDPTGTQTVHDVPVVTRWSVDHLARELEDAAPASYILTNSRSLPTAAAESLAREIGANVREAAVRTGRDFTLVSRSDSTLRGHFPAEVDALAAGLQTDFDAWVLCPYFGEGGRLTIGDVHYVADGEQLVPAAATPFAADAAFGYRHSNLRDWIVEKSRGAIVRDRIVSLSIEELRSGDVAGMEKKLRELRPGSVLIVNAADPRDLTHAVRALLVAERAGRRFLCRTAASFVATRAGIGSRALLEPHELSLELGRGVLVIVGSYVPKTTAQLDHVLEHHRPVAVELDVRELAEEAKRRAIVDDLAKQADEALARDGTVVVYTSREVQSADPDASLSHGSTISQTLVALVRAVPTRPRALIGKGGITSSDLATGACEVERATVLGQILAGVPVWRCGGESRTPGMPLVVFPGNVGDDDALSAVVGRLR